MSISLALSQDTAVSTAIAEALAEAPVRVRMLETPAGRMWLKRVEQLSLRWRLQKGSGRKSFERDREGLHVMGAAGLPVAPIVAEGPDYFVTPDLGITLRALMADAPEDERLRAFAAAGAALAALHARGYSHGRPAVRDLCWDGAEVRFIDMEKFSALRDAPRHFATDVLVFIHSVFAAGGGAAELDAALEAYSQAAPRGWAATVALTHRFGWLAGFARTLRSLKPRSRELNAVEPTLAYVTARA